MFDLIAQTPPTAESTASPSTPNTGVTNTGVTSTGTAQTAAQAATQTMAQTGASGTPAAKQPPGLFVMAQQVGPIILMVVLFFFLMNRSKKKQEKGRTDMLTKLKKGDEVQTIGGILGKVMEAREDRVLLKVDENSNTKIWFSRTAIHRVVGAEEEIK